MNNIRLNLNKIPAEVIDSGWCLLGFQVTQIENELSDYIETSNVVGIANALDALRLILRAYKELSVVKDGDEVIVPAYTYLASILAITDNNRVPVFVEPNLLTYKIETLISEKTKAIMVVHLYDMIC